MSAKIKGFIVTLNEDLHRDDIYLTVGAIAQIKNVASVVYSEADIGDLMARQRVSQELKRKLYDFIQENLK